MSSKITIYGADWCGDTSRTRELLDELSVPYTYVDIDQDPSAEEMIAEANGGKRVTPTVDLGDGEMLFEPSDEVMEAALANRGMI
jgi:glutaredoxin